MNEEEIELAITVYEYRMENNCAFPNKEETSPSRWLFNGWKRTPMGGWIIYYRRKSSTAP